MDNLKVHPCLLGSLCIKPLSTVVFYLLFTGLVVPIELVVESRNSFCALVLPTLVKRGQAT